MEYRRLGKSELMVSQIGFGSMSLDVSDPESETLLLSAIDNGINYFDTADIYQKGLNENLLGRVLKSRRQNILLATKVGNQWRPDGSGLDWKPTKKYIVQAVEESLRRLQTDYIDLYQLHGGTLDDPIDDIIEIFEKLRFVGKIRYYGLSSIRPNVIREYVNRSNIVGVMMQYSLLDRRPEEEILSLLEANQISVLVRGALAKGLLITKPATAFLNYSEEQVKQMVGFIHLYCKNKRTAEATALQYVLRNPAVCSVVVGLRTQEQLSRAIQGLAYEALSSAEMQTLKDYIPVNAYDQHR